MYFSITFDLCQVYVCMCENGEKNYINTQNIKIGSTTLKDTKTYTRIYIWKIFFSLLPSLIVYKMCNNGWKTQFTK